MNKVFLLTYLQVINIIHNWCESNPTLWSSFDLIFFCDFRRQSLAKCHVLFFEGCQIWPAVGRDGPLPLFTPLLLATPSLSLSSSSHSFPSKLPCSRILFNIANLTHQIDISLTWEKKTNRKVTQCMWFSIVVYGMWLIGDGK